MVGVEWKFVCGSRCEVWSVILDRKREGVGKGDLKKVDEPAIMFGDFVVITYGFVGKNTCRYLPIAVFAYYDEYTKSA